MNGTKKVLVKFDQQKNADHRRFYKSISFVVVLGQIFGIMPVNGANGPSERYIQFKWKSWKMLYTLLVVIGSLFCVCASLYHMVNKGGDLGIVSAVVFYLNSVVVHLLFIFLAKDWAFLMRKWSLVDVEMRSYGWPPNFDRKLRLITWIVLSFATLEHFFVIMTNFVRACQCRRTFGEISEYFFAVKSFSQIFSSTTYNFGAGLLLQIMTTISTFSWTYIDLFIILMSTSLALRFRQVAERVESYLETSVSDVALWRNLREDYNRLGKLCRILNEHMSYIVLLSFGSNMYFILVQFFNSLKPLRDATEMVYFYFSFGFLIARTVCVSLYGSWIHDESQRVLPLLNSVPSGVYNIEIKRFILHVGIETISLTGKRFFNVTRSMVLSIAGTVVTYELVLIQFYGGQIQSAANQTYSC